MTYTRKKFICCSGVASVFMGLFNPLACSVKLLFYRANESKILLGFGFPWEQLSIRNRVILDNAVNL